MTKRVSLHDRADAGGITDVAAAKTSSVVDTLIAPAGQTVDLIDVDQLFAHPDNPRGQVGDVDELAESIKANGLLEPLIVCHGEAWQALDDRLPYLTSIDYVIIAGHRRKTAAVQAGVRAVPCIVRDDLVGVNAEIAMLVENLQREDLDAIQEARGYQRLEAQGKSQREISRLVGKTQPHVSKRLSLLKLPEEIQARITADELAITDAVEAARYADDPAVLRAVLNRSSYETAERVAERVTQQRKEAAELEQERQKWRDRGVQKLVEFRSWGLGPYDTPRKLEHLEADGVDVTEHEHFVCHAMAVGHDTAGNVRAVAVCTSPKAHPESRENKLGVAQQKAAAKEQRDKAGREKRAAARRDTLTAIVAAKKLPDAAVDLAERFLLADLIDQVYDASELLTLVDVLRLPADGAADAESRTAVRDRLDTYVNSAPGNARRALIAAVLVQIETVAEAGGWFAVETLRPRYLTLLEAHGHKLTGPEIKAAKEKATDPTTPAQPTVDEYDGVTCPECDHAEPQEACACTSCFCNPENVDEPAAAEAVPA